MPRSLPSAGSPYPGAGKERFLRSVWVAGSGSQSVAGTRPAPAHPQLLLETVHSCGHLASRAQMVLPRGREGEGRGEEEKGGVMIAGCYYIGPAYPRPWVEVVPFQNKIPCFVFAKGPVKSHLKTKSRSALLAFGL